MRIALIYPRLHRITGAQRLVLKLAAYLSQKSHKVEVVTFELSEACRSLLPKEVVVRQVGPRRIWTGHHFRNAIMEYLLSPRLGFGLESHSDSAVFFGTSALPALMALRAKRYRGRIAYFCYEPPRVLYTDREAITARLGIWGTLVNLSARPLALLDRLTVRSVPVLLTNSNYVRRKLAGLYGRDAHVITHGVDLPTAPPEALATLRAELKIDVKAPVVLTVNHLHPRKRVDLYLQVMATLKELFPNVVGIVVGDGIERQALERQAAGLGIRDSIRFVGWVAEEALPVYYGLATVYLHTAREESFGLSVVEAMAAGIPVVAVAEGGPTETVVDGVTGFLAPASREELAQRAAHLVADRRKAAVMGTEAQKLARAKYSWSKGAADLLEALLGETP